MQTCFPPVILKYTPSCRQGNLAGSVRIGLADRAFNCSSIKNRSTEMFGSTLFFLTVVKYPYKNEKSIRKPRCYSFDR